MSWKLEALPAAPAVAYGIDKLGPFPTEEAALKAAREYILERRMTKSTWAPLRYIKAVRS